MSIAKLRANLAHAKKLQITATTGLTPEDVEAALAEVDQLTELLWNFTAPNDPCQFDHHGYCQAHSWLRTEPACPHERAKRILEGK